jgi:hypothetical protein
MKKVMRFSLNSDDSEIHKEAHKARLTKGKLKRKAEVDISKQEVKIKLKPKCSK